MAAEIVVRPSVVADVYRLAASLRDSNRDEIVDLGLDPRVALRANFRMAMLRRTYLVDGEVAAMTGLCGSLLGDIGFPYLMTAPPVERVPVAFLKLARRGPVKLDLANVRADLRAGQVGDAVADAGVAQRFLG